jgi:hypothetical protein
MGMSVHKIVEQMGKIDLKNQTKIVTFENGWLWHQIETLYYKHPRVTSSNLGENLTSFKCHESLFHIWHEYYVKLMKIKMFREIFLK